MPPTLLFDRSDRARFYFSGAQITATLNGLVTNDVATLAPGQGQYAGILTPKSKILADVRLFSMAPPSQAGESSSSTTKNDSSATNNGSSGASNTYTRPSTTGNTSSTAGNAAQSTNALKQDAPPTPVFLMDTGPAQAPGVRDFLKKYLNPRFAKHTDVSDSTADIGVFGANASEIVAKVINLNPQEVASLPAYTHLSALFGQEPVTVIRTPELGMPGYDLILAREHAASLQRHLLDAGAHLGTPEQWKARQVVIGWPEWGEDMNDTTLPQEANFDDLNALSHTKGCYIGHETIARIHFRGHVNRTLRRLVFLGSEAPPRSATLADSSGKQVGTVTSVTTLANDEFIREGLSTPLDTTTVIGLGMVRREIEDGVTLTVTWDTGTTSAQVVGKAKGTVD